MLGPVNSYAQQAQIANGIKTTKETGTEAQNPSENEILEGIIKETASPIEVNKDNDTKSKNNQDKLASLSEATKNTDEPPSRGSILDITV